MTTRTGHDGPSRATPAARRPSTGPEDGRHVRTPGAVGIGRIARVPLRLHWSVAVITVMIGWALVSALWAAYPAVPRWALVGYGSAGTVVFLGCLLAHEFAHAAVARQHGIDVDSITLWMFGGVSQLHGRPRTPGAELRIAGAGPLVSLVLGATLWLLGTALGSGGAVAPITATLLWLGAVNLLLAAFNLVPAAPLDGGRLLKAVLWRYRGDQRWAGRAAARAGRVFGLVLVVLGIADFALTGAWTALWPAVMGWFLTSAAAAEERQVERERSLADIVAGQVMTSEPETVDAARSVADLVEMILGGRHSTFPVVDSGAVVGLVTLRRVKQVPMADRMSTRVADIAIPLPKVPVCGPDLPIAELMTDMAASPDGRALVLDDGRLVGIVAPSDIVRVAERTGLRRPARP